MNMVLNVSRESFFNTFEPSSLRSLWIDSNSLRCRPNASHVQHRIALFVGHWLLLVLSADEVRSLSTIFDTVA